MADATLAATKVCSKCGEEKPLSTYYDQRASRDGKRADCGDCSRARRRRYYHRNVEVERERYNDWRSRNPDYQREWFAANADARKAKAAEYYRANIPRYRANAERWRRENPERARELALANYYRRREDAKFRVNHALSATIYRSLRSAKGGKPTFDLLGYSLAELMAHLERQFLKGMTWDNFGKWHIDHILPLSSFNYSTPDEADFRRAWALTNLRPLWGKDNLAKGAKRLTLL